MDKWKMGMKSTLTDLGFFVAFEFFSFIFKSNIKFWELKEDANCHHWKRITFNIERQPMARGMYERKISSCPPFSNVINKCQDMGQPNHIFTYTGWLMAYIIFTSTLYYSVHLFSPSIFDERFNMYWLLVISQV